ncbi:hypothetical protein ABZ135_32695 [Streptomyces sp. NPDC006339]|uniref:hypothetical protein n=1 Tax=Streptomyces sp. NPDC006339 TaxID=3156755 RepID=UPI0033AED7FD
MTHRFVVDIPFDNKETGARGQQWLWVQAEDKLQARAVALQEAAGETATRHRYGAVLVLNDPTRPIEVSAG